MLGLVYSFYQPYIDLIVLCLVCTTIVLVFKLQLYKAQLHRQNVQLISLHLDTKFIANILKKINQRDVSVSDIRQDIIDQVKEYFQLDDIMLYNEDSTYVDIARNVYIRSTISKYIANNLEEITQALSTSKSIIKHIIIHERTVVLYITSAYYTKPLSLMIFIQYGKEHLASHEINTLCGTVVHLLSYCTILQNS